MCEIYIHVGIPKSGSTFLQKSIFPFLTEISYFTEYPYLVNLVQDLPNKSFEYDAEMKRQELYDFLKGNNIKKLLISNESLFGHPLFNYFNHELVIKNLQILFPAAKIIVVLRKQVDFFESLYKYCVFLGYPVTKKQFFGLEGDSFQGWKYNGGLNVNVYALDYFRLTEVYERYYSRDSIHLLLYEELSRHQERFLAKLLQVLGHPPQQFDTSRKVNEGMTAFQMKMLFAINRFFRSSISNGFGLIKVRPFRNFALQHYEKSRFALVLLHISGWIDPRKIIRNFKNLPSGPYKVFAEEEKQRIQSHYSESNKALAKKYNLDLAQFGYIAGKGESVFSKTGFAAT